MADRVRNPSTPDGLAGLKLRGTWSQLVAGNYTVTPPIGARFARIEMRGGGGRGGGQSGNGGGGGGEGALQRRFVPLKRGDFAVVVGAGASASAGPGDGGDSTALGLTAAGGKPGTFNEVVPGAGGIGADGAEPIVGLGSFSGQSGAGSNGGGQGGGRSNPSAAATRGGGGAGAAPRAQVGDNGYAGGAGYILIEFYGPAA